MQWVLVYFQSCAEASNFRTFPAPSKETLYPWAVRQHLPPPPDHFTFQPLETTEPLSVSVSVLGRSCTGAQPTRGLWDWLLSLSLMFVSKMEASWFICFFVYLLGLPWWLRQKRVCLQYGRAGFDPWVRKIPWRRKWQPHPVFLPGKSHGWRSLAGYSPWGRKESDMTEWLHFHFICLLIYF